MNYSRPLTPPPTDEEDNPFYVTQTPWRRPRMYTPHTEVTPIPPNPISGRPRNYARRGRRFRLGQGRPDLARVLFP